MTELARYLNHLGFTLRSGAAPGADMAFELGAANSLKEIYLPWRWFNASRSPLVNLDQAGRARAIVETVHPQWAGLSESVRKLHTRNVFQVLGRDLNSPSRFVVCWTPDGAENEAERSRETGGTGTAIVIASRFGVPVFNMQRQNAYSRLSARLDDYVKTQ